mgnify:CR=1 FL=1
MESINSFKINLTDLQAFKELETNLLDQLKSSYTADKTINDDFLESLYFIYKSPLLEALNQIDKCEKKILQECPPQALADTLFDLVISIQCVSVPNRVIYQVKGSFDYYLYENLNFCGCPSFKYGVLNSNEHVYCKHMILVKLLKAMNRMKVKYVNHTELVDIIKQI